MENVRRLERTWLAHALAGQESGTKMPDQKFGDFAALALKARGCLVAIG